MGGEGKGKKVINTKYEPGTHDSFGILTFETYTD